MKILMIDVGGTNVKLMATGQDEVRSVPSGKRMTAMQMVREVKAATEDWRYDAITLGYPSPVLDGRPAREPFNLGGGWMRLDYDEAFGKPVRCINDAAMQALASYRGGRLLFLGFGTSVGSALIVDDTIISLEVGSLCLPTGARIVDRCNDKHLATMGRRRWAHAARSAIIMLQEVCHPDETVLGGGNAKELHPLPKGCRRRDNEMAFIGAQRLWPGADMLATSHGTSWRITQRKEKAKTKKQPRR